MTTEYSIDLNEFYEPYLEKIAEARAKFLDSLSPEERVKEEVRYAHTEEVGQRLCEEEHLDYEASIHGAELATAERERQIGSDRAAGIIGTMTELGRPFGLSGVKVGRILDEHGLRNIVDVEFNLDGSPEEDCGWLLHPNDNFMSNAIEGYTRRQKERWAAYHAEFYPNKPVDPVEPVQKTRSFVLHLFRGEREGFAIRNNNSQVFWITAKVAPLLEPHTVTAKKKK